jgi:repressor LexA
MDDLTPRQREVLELIRATVREKGFPPTVRELGEKLGINSPNGVFQHLAELERKGYLKRSGGKSRMLTLTEKKADTTIPLKGKVS